MKGKRQYYSILLGAGASADAGLPTSQKLLTDFIASSSVQTQSKIRSIARANIVNIEELSIALGRLDKQLYRELRRFTISQLVNIKDPSYLQHLYSPDLDSFFGLDTGDNPVWRLARNFDSLAKHRLTTMVFTLNYDLSVETAYCRAEKSRFDYRMFDIDLADLERSHYEYQYKPGMILNNMSHKLSPGIDADKKTYYLNHNEPKIIKLHGSINWLWKGLGDKRRLTLREGPLINEADFDKVEIIFGEVDKLRMTPPYSDLFYLFSSALSSSSVLITVGYSWQDDHINKMIYHEVKNGLRVVSASRFSRDKRVPEDILPRGNVVYVRSNCKQLLSSDGYVDLAFGAGKWQSLQGGLGEVIRRTLQKDIFPEFNK